MADEDTSIEDVNSDGQTQATEAEAKAAQAGADGESAQAAVEDAKQADGAAQKTAKEDAGEDLEDKPKPLTRRDARIEQLLGDNRAMQRFADQELAKRADLEKRAIVLPRPEDFQSDQAYMQAVADQAVAKAQLALVDRQIGQARERAAETAAEAWQERTADFRVRAPDFDTVAHNPNLKITPVMADAIRESGLGAEIAYFLGKNPHEAARIASLAPISQATAIARLETRVQKASPQTQTRAPAAVEQSLKGKGSGGKILESMSFEEYRKARGF